MNDAPPLPATGARRNARKLALGGLLVVAVYVAIVLAADAGSLLEALGRLDPLGLALALWLVVVVYVVRSLRWRLYLGQLGVLAPRGPIGFWAAFAMGLPQGKWGQVVKAWALRARARTPYPRALPTIFAERVSDVVGGLLHLAVGLALVPEAGARAFAVALAAIAGALVLLRSRLAARLAVRTLSWIPWVRRHQESVMEGHERLRAHVTPRELAAPSTMALAAFLVESLALWAIAVVGFGLPLGVAEAILILALVDAAATITFLPGGVGAAEASMLVLLALEGIPLAEAAAITLLFRASTLWFGIGLGVLGVAALRVLPDKRLGAPAQA